MAATLRSLGVIAARGQSKRVPRKMLRSVAGTPLLAYMAGAAAGSHLDRVVLSTDDQEIAALGRQIGLDVPFLRPAELATDFVSNNQVLLHALDAVADGGAPFDVIVLLQPTAPFTKPSDIDACLDVLATTDANCCFTATTVSQQPHWMFEPTASGEVKLLIGGHLTGDRQHTQKLPQHLHPSGAVWAVRVGALRETGRIYCEPMRTVLVERERAIDLDTELDFIVAEAVARHFAFTPLPTTN